MAARKDPWAFWEGVVVGHPMPTAIEGGVISDRKADCHMVTEASKEQPDKLLKDFGRKVKKAFAKDFVPIPNLALCL